MLPQIVSAQDPYYGDWTYGDQSQYNPLFDLICGMMYLLYFIVVIILAVWIYKDAVKYKQNGGIWVIIILFTSFIGLIIWLAYRKTLKDKVKTTTSFDRCPNCGLKLLKNSKFCHLCGYSFDKPLKEKKVEKPPEPVEKKEETEKVVYSDDELSIKQHFQRLKDKSLPINLDEIDDLIKSREKDKLQKAKKLLEEKEQQYTKYLLLQDDLKNIRFKINNLTRRLADGDLDSEAYNRALNDLENQQKDYEEKIWKLQNKLFKDEYEKPF
jgi:hypothetical protein